MNITTAAFAAALCGTAAAQTVTQVPLDYNFNGIVHLNEDANPDDPMGYRSISDRGLDFTAGVPNVAILAPYSIVGTAGSLDIVHIGNRNLVNGGAFAFQPMANGDNIGTQPVWLVDPDQSTPQATTLTSPIQLSGNCEASFLLQASNLGGSLDVVFGFQSGATTTASIGAGDWFGGSLAGMGGVDNATPDNNLNVQERAVDLSAFNGQRLTSITFQNSSNPGAGFAVLACNVTTDIPGTTSTPVPLAYNFNGIAHAGEMADPDNLDGYRSISDRGLDFSAGVPANPVSDGFVLVPDPFVVDMVHLGNREAVDGGSKPFDLTPDGDNLGVQPTWLPAVDQSTPQTTTLASPIGVGTNGRAEVLFHISNGGGDFTVQVQLANGNSIFEVISGPDWFGGTFPGVGNVDLAGVDANLNLTVGEVDLSAASGETITAITFRDSTNSNAGVAIFAVNIVSEGLGANYCMANDNSTGVPGVMGAQGSTLVAANDVTLTASNLPPSQFGIFVASRQQGFVPNTGGTSNGNLCLAGTLGRFTMPSQIFQIPLTGTASLPIDLNAIPEGGVLSSVQPGETWYFQAWHREFGGAGSNFTDGLAIAFQ